MLTTWALAPPSLTSLAPPADWPAAVHTQQPSFYYYICATTVPKYASIWMPVRRHREALHAISLSSAPTALPRHNDRYVPWRARSRGRVQPRLPATTPVYYHSMYSIHLPVQHTTPMPLGLARRPTVRACRGSHNHTVCEESASR